MHQLTAPPLDIAIAAYPRTLAGANKSAVTIRAYRTNLAHFLTFLRETHCAVDYQGEPLSERGRRRRRPVGRRTTRRSWTPQEADNPSRLPALSAFQANCRAIRAVRNRHD
ncbi:MAG: hypothetical protein ACRDJC_07625 [Thermomicrobiales bacterium]